LVDNSHSTQKTLDTLNICAKMKLSYNDIEYATIDLYPTGKKPKNLSDIKGW